MDVCMETVFDKVFDTQKIYRHMLDAMARPGKIQKLPVLNIYPPEKLSSFGASLGLTLLDSETTFAVMPANEDWQDYFVLQTGARPVAPEMTEFIILNGSEYLPGLALVNKGTLPSPERGGTLFVLVESIGRDLPGSIRVTLAGPGIWNQTQILFNGLHLNNLDIICGLNHEYPLGVDCFFVDDKGNMAAIPRSATIRWEVTG